VIGERDRGERDPEAVRPGGLVLDDENGLSAPGDEDLPIAAHASSI
jgi:hypothetical protein